MVETPLTESADLGGQARGARAWLKRALIVTKCAVSGVLLWFLITRYAPSAEHFTRINLAWAAIATALLLIQPVLNAQRWRLLLARFDAKPALKTVYAVYYSALFFMQVLPSIGGDVIRALYFRSLGAAPGATVISVLLDRALALVSLMIVLVASVPFVLRLAGSDAAFVLAAIGIGSLGAVFGFAAALPLIRRMRLWRSAPDALRHALDSLRWSLFSKVALTRLFPMSIAVHVISVAAIYFCALSMGMGGAALIAAAAAGPAMLLAQILPISIGGWGMREMTAVIMLQGAGIDPTNAVVLSVVFGLCALVAALPGLPAWLTLKT